MVAHVTSRGSNNKKQRLAAEPQWSKYQLAVFDWLENGEGHAQLEAVAGSGKTTTILGIVNRIATSCQSTAVVAFNRHVAQELKRKLGSRSGLTISTCHSLGLGILRRYFGGMPIEPNERKYHQLCKKAMQSLLKLRVEYEQDWINSPERAQEKYSYHLPSIGKGTKESKQLESEMFKLLKDAVRYSQMTLTEPSPKALRAMIQHFSLESPKDERAINCVMHLVSQVLEEAEKAASQNLDISLEDLIWLPNKWDIKVPQKAFLLWDEGQDANAAMLGLCLKAVEDGGRLIAIGDRRQAIMGFSGSDSNSWNRIYEATSPTVLPLSLCYRCPTSHIALAKHIVPQIEARNDAPEGTIEVISRKQAKELVQQGDLVISRFTAPLVSLCLQLVIGGEKARVRGRELGTDLTELIKRSVSERDYPSQFYVALNAYCLPKLTFLQQQGDERKLQALLDRLEAIKACFGAFGLDCEKLQQFCDRVENLFSDEDEAVILSTIHRAKGDESNRVFILGCNFLPFLCKADLAWQIEQEWNLVYVALTRAKYSFA
jgi:superfamily I DNA/RNA helicase